MPWVKPDLLDPQDHLETLMDQKKVPLESLAHRGNLEKTGPLGSLALRERKAPGASLGSGAKMALRDGKGTLALQDFVVHQNITMYTR